MTLYLIPSEFAYVYISPTLQRQNAEISKQIFPEKEYRGLSFNFHIFPTFSHDHPLLNLSLCTGLLFRDVVPYWYGS
jgi:hypothetical protein